MIPQPGDRIELVHMPDDPAPIEPGTRGTVRRVNHLTYGPQPCEQLSVKWDNGRTLSPCIPPDTVTVIDRSFTEQMRRAARLQADQRAEQNNEVCTVYIGFNGNPGVGNPGPRAVWYVRSAEEGPPDDTDYVTDYTAGDRT